LERLRALEALEAEMLTKKTAEEHDADRFKMLRERDKADPEAVAKRALKYYYNSETCKLCFICSSVCKR
jgi:hypothetical protein